MYEHFKTRKEQINYLYSVINDYATTIDEDTCNSDYLKLYDDSVQYRLNDGSFDLIDKDTLYAIWNKGYEIIYDAMDRYEETH